MGGRIAVPVGLIDCINEKPLVKIEEGNSMFVSRYFLFAALLSFNLLAYAQNNSSRASEQLMIAGGPADKCAK
jgi:hypothetical protein